MALASITSLLAELGPQLPQCERPMLLQYLRRAARALCREAYAWREEISGVALAANVKAYAVPNAASYAATPYAILGVKRVDASGNGRELPEAAYRLNEDGRLEFEQGYYPTAATTDTLTLTVAWLPSDRCDDYPERLLGRWSQGIVAHAAYCLQAMSGKPWSDAQLAKENHGVYSSSFGEAKQEYWTGGRSGMMTVQIPRFV